MRLTRKLVGCFFLFFLVPLGLKAQGLEHWEALIGRAEAYAYSNLDSSIYFCQQVEQGTRNKYPTTYAKALRVEAQVYLTKGDYKKVSILLSECIPMLEEQENKAELASAYNLLSILSNRFYKRDQALEYLLKAMELYQGLGNKEGINKIAGNLFQHYIEADDVKNAYRYLKIQENSVQENSKNQFYFYNNSGLYHGSLKDYKQALAFYEKAKSVAQAFEMDDAYISANLNLGRCYESMNQYAWAEKTYNAALSLAEQKGLLPEQKQLLEQLYDLHSSQKAFQKCFEVGQKLRPLIDSLYSAEKVVFIQELETSSRLSEKQRLINEQKNELLQGKLRQNELNQQVLIYSLVFFVVLAFALFIFFIYFKIRRKNHIILRQKVEAELQKDRLQESHELNQKIFAIVSHDFKGPLNSLEILVDLLDENKENQDLAFKLLGDVKNQIVQSNSVLENLISFAKAELDQRPHVPQRINVRQLLEQILLQQRSEIQDKKVEVLNLIDPEFSLAVSQDLLHIVLRNLISNAIKYSNEGGEVKVRNLRKHTISVEDFGVGLRPELAEQLFKTNVKSSLGTNFETGFGLGLKISAELCEKMNAHLKYESKPTGGTIFSVKFVQV